MLNTGAANLDKTEFPRPQGTDNKRSKNLDNWHER
jgi:hypothetical protein